MGLANTIQSAAKTAFKAIGNVAITCTYTSKGTQTYNVTTGLYTSTDTTYPTAGQPDLKFLFEDYSSAELADQNILSTDQKATIPQLNLTPTPKKTDYLTDDNSVVWQIEGIGQDSARATWVLQVRKP